MKLLRLLRIQQERQMTSWMRLVKAQMKDRSILKCFAKMKLREKV